MIFVYLKLSFTGQVWVDIGGKYVEGGVSEGTLPFFSYRGSPPEVNQMYYYTYQKTPSSSYVADGEIESSSQAAQQPVQAQVIIGTTRPSWIRERPHE